VTGLSSLDAANKHEHRLVCYAYLYRKVEYGDESVIITLIIQQACPIKQQQIDAFKLIN